jgi:hypothetical protein
MINLILDFLGDWLVLLPRLKRKRERRREWSGTVEAKKTGGLSKHAYLVIFRTDDGQRKKVRMDRKEDLDNYKEGRKYLKKAGEDLPDTRPAA